MSKEKVQEALENIEFEVNRATRFLEDIEDVEIECMCCGRIYYQFNNTFCEECFDKREDEHKEDERLKVSDKLNDIYDLSCFQKNLLSTLYHVVLHSKYNTYNDHIQEMIERLTHHKLRKYLIPFWQTCKEYNLYEDLQLNKGNWMSGEVTEYCKKFIQKHELPY